MRDMQAADPPECTHFWAHCSPAGSRHFVRLCSRCGAVDPESLNRDYAEHRQQVAEEIALAIEADAERRKPSTLWQKIRAGAAGPNSAAAWHFRGLHTAARIAREIGGTP